eukprot:Sdes_comp19734_c0_seq4m11718
MSQKSPQSAITTHVLDTATGKPAAGMPITLFYLQNNTMQVKLSGLTNQDGRCPDIYIHPDDLKAGLYKICFDTGSYFLKNSIQGFYPHVEVLCSFAHTFQIHHSHLESFYSPSSSPLDSF